MANIITASILMLFFLGFVFSSVDSSLNLMGHENEFLHTRSVQYLKQSDSLLNANIEDLKIGKLD